MDLQELIMLDPVVADLAEAKEVCWVNPRKAPFAQAKDSLAFGPEDIAEASKRLAKFAPLLMEIFPETAETNGIIESPLTEIPAMKTLLKEKYGADLGGGRLFLKRDSDLAVAGSIKARGGFYDVLKHTEDLAIEGGFLDGPDDDPMKLASPEARAFFAKHKVQVASTGNLGISIGMMSAYLGYQAIVHMSADAKQWKKDYLRAHGVTVVEYAGDYGKAITEGRAISDADPDSYFVDDENSKELFMGYAVAAERLQKQLETAGVAVDEDHPLIVTIPCGVGGAPGGVAFGLKEIYGDNVHIFFAEPVQASCMVLGMATDMHNQICVQDIGLSGKTHADGLAVGRASSLVGRIMQPLLAGEVTLEDYRLYDYMRDLDASEGLFIEPSSCAAFHGPVMIAKAPELRAWIYKEGLADKMDNASYIVWATGGKLVPEEARKAFKETYLK
ncbi:MAG: D-serine ammonia-lyase [Firmicutes bacterium]|nr:D-serine ammonia-lyase [Bacillota bacterium]